MRRKLFTLAAVASVALCAASAVLWERSRDRVDSFGCGFGDREVRLTSCGRTVGIEVSTFVPPCGPKRGLLRETWKSFNATPSASFLDQLLPDLAVVPASLHQGFGLTDTQTMQLTQDGTLAVLVSRNARWFVPWWAACAATAVLPAAWCGSVVRRRLSPRPPGRCIACGYDLRATPDRCPECGTVVAEGARS